MLAVYVNCGAIILGSILGILLSNKFSKKMEDAIQTGAGIVVLVLGMQMAFKFENVIYLTLSVILGGIVGTLIDLDGQILKLGKFIERFVSGKKTKNDETNDSSLPLEEKKSNFAYGFLNASVLFCVGAMSILGSLKAGIEKDYSIIFTKSILDGFMAISFAAAMGVGTAFSALAVLIYQGALTLLSGLVQPFCTDQMIAELTGCGGCLICMIGINLIGLKKIKTANYLPAIVWTVIFVAVSKFLPF